MKSRNYDEQKVVADLNKKSDIRIANGQVRELSKGKGDVGIKSRGKIDFLTKYLDYTHFYVEKFN